MLVILLPAVTPLKLLQYENALLAMLTTGRPAMVLGIVTEPPEPVYPVMVIAPLLMV